MFAFNDNQSSQPHHFLTDYLLSQLYENGRDISDDPNDLELHIQRACIYVALQWWDSVLSQCNEILLLEPLSDFAYTTRGLARGHLGDYTGALADIDSSLKLNSQYALAFENRADVEVLMSNWQKAVTDYSTSLELDPASIYSRVRRAQCYCVMGKRQDAQVDYQMLADSVESDSEKASLWQQIFGQSEMEFAKDYGGEFEFIDPMEDDVYG